MPRPHFAFLLIVLASCKSECADPASSLDAGASPYEGVPITETLAGSGLSARVEVVRDDYGIPHIYGATDADVLYAQGYMMASDRFVQMDLGRHQASGTLTELFGKLSPTLIDSDIQYRTHHLRRNAEQTWASLQASTDAFDQKVAAALKSFTAGVNAWQADLKAGKRSLPESLSIFYSAAAVTPWSEIDSLALGELQAFELSFDAESEIWNSALDKAEAKTFAGSSDPAMAARVGFVADFTSVAPFDPTTTVDGWGSAKLAKNGKRPRGRGASPSSGSLALLRTTADALKGVGRDRLNDPSRGSNSWVVSGKLTMSGRPIVANDTHLSLDQPAIFYLSHLQSLQGLDVMGAQFPGIPLIILGANRHVAWGSTVSNVDATDVYLETIKACADGNGQCVVWKGQEVKLTSRVETFRTGQNGQFSDTKEVTFYDVPHHGPILLRSTLGDVTPLGAAAFSVRYTGHEPAPLFRAVYGLVTANSVDEGRAALDKDFKYGAQNWMLADDRGDILWTQTSRVPRRPKGTRPFKVLPGDGSAEWDGYFDVRALPAAKNPEKGFLVTANADPLGVTLDNDPTNEPDIDGFPLYLGADYDPGTRVGRITKRLVEATKDGKKVSRDDMAAIQADAFTEFGQAVAPAFLEGARALDEELKTPGAHPELSSVAAGVSAEVKASLPAAVEAMAGWSFDTPAGNDGDTPEQLRDSRATVVYAAFTTRLAANVLGDELRALGAPASGSRPLKMLVTLLSKPSALKTADKVWDNLETPATETRLGVLAASVAGALDWITKKSALGPNPDAWRWGSVHRLVSEFPLPVGLNQEPTPRHGADGTVDVAFHGTSNDDYDFSHGPAIRFVAEVDPDKGPVARNVTAGGQIFRKDSPHYGDLFALWTKNQAIDLAFRHEEIVPRAQAEHAKNGLGRIVFEPSP